MKEAGEVLARRLALIGNLDEGDREALLALQGQARTVQKGTDVLRHGDFPTESVLVVSGLMCRYKLLPEGRRQIHSFYLAGDTPSLESIPIERMDNNLATMSDSRLAFIAHADLCRIFRERPNIQNLVWRETLVQAATFREWLTRNSLLPADAAMAHLFCEIMVRAEASGLTRDDSCELPVTQHDLAEALGLSDVHINRTLMVLRELGVELKNGVLSVKNLQQLQRFARFDPSYLYLQQPAKEHPASVRQGSASGAQGAHFSEEK